MPIRPLIGYATVLGVSAFVAAGCAGNSVPENAICTVNNEPVLTKEYDRIIGQAEKNYKSQGQKFPAKDSQEFKQLNNQAVDYLIEQELFRQQADELGVKIEDKDVDERLNQLKDSFFKGDKKAYEQELKKQGLTEGEVKDNIRQQLLSEKLFEQVTKGVKVSDEDAEKYFKENPAQYKQPESRTVAHILVDNKSRSDKKAKQLADQLYEQVKGGDKAAFTKLAKKHSDDPSSAQNGGELQVAKGQTVPEFDAKAFSIKDGEVTAPVKTQFGYHIITARGDITPEKQQKFDEVKAQIKQTLEQEQRSKRMQDWRTDLRKDAEKNVNCKDGYVWTQTVTETTSDEPPAAEETPAEAGHDEAAEEETKDEKAGDEKADASEEKASDEDAGTRRND